MIYARYDVRTAHVEAIGTLFDNSEEVKAGSGLLIGDAFVLTNNHVIPPENNYRTLVVNARLKSRKFSPVRVVAVHRDPERDLALLELPQPIAGAGGRRCPMPVILPAAGAPPGTGLFVMGYPVNKDLSIIDGMVSNHSDDPLRWQINSLLNPGNSGGPAFDARGALVGIAVGGVTDIDTGGGNKTRVTGVNFIIPAATLVASPLYAKISQLPADRRCWEDDIWTFGWGWAVTEQSSDLPSQLNRSHSVAQTKDDHPGLVKTSERYQKRFDAEPGYRITACAPESVSANNAHDLFCNIQPGGTTAVFEFRLESGPAFDRWRGWWTGTVTLEQELAALPPVRNLTRSYSVSVTKDDHPSLTSAHSRSYSRQFSAEPGYFITSCSPSTTSASNARDVMCNIEPGGESATFQFSLVSGSRLNRYRGWWTGSVTIGQELRR